MNVAFTLSLVTFSLNLAMAIGHFAVSRAPGWRASRAFSLVALTACLYSLCNAILADPFLASRSYLVVIRLNYVMGHLHTLAWYPLAFGGPDASLRNLSPRMRRWLAVSLGLLVLFALTGLHVTTHMYVVNVAWANAQYRYVTTTPLGDAYGALMLVTLAFPFVEYIRRARRGERELSWTVAGFTVFYACAVLEALVASHVVSTISPADLGFLAVVLPTSAQLVRRFNADARRLSALGDDLASQVRLRTEQLEHARSALAESERLAALGRLAAGVGHEINNPLTYVQLSLEEVGEYLAGVSAPPEVHGALASAMDGTRRIQHAVEGLRTYSKHAGEFAPCDPHELVRAALEAAGPQLKTVAIVETRLDDAPRVMCDAPRFVQALAHLLVNAAQAVDGQPGGGHVVVRTLTGPQGECGFEIEDDGPGIPAPDRARVIEPYFTTRARQGGLGLGLFVTRGIVVAHGGALTLGDGPGRGTAATILLPPLAPGQLHDGARPAPAVSPVPAWTPAPASASSGRLRVLVVDDEPVVLRLLEQLLEPEWRVTSAGGGAEALEALASGPFDAILCDLMMSGMSGIDLAARIAIRDPAQRRRMVFLTGGAVSPGAQAFVARPDVTHLMKPVDCEALSAALRAACAADGADTQSVGEFRPGGA